MKSLLHGIVAIIFVSVILLLSDLGNRTHKREITGRSGNSGRQVAKCFKLGLVHYVDSPNSEECEKGIRNALSDNNLTENVNYSMKVFNAQGDISTLNNIAGSLSNEKYDLIFSLSTPTLQIMSKKLQGQKIVFTNVGDPVAAGAGESYQNHLPNICGISTISDFDGLLKFAELLQPGIRKIGTVYTPSEVNSVIYKDKLNEAAGKNGLTLIAAPASTALEVMEAAKSLVMKRIDAFCQISDNLTGSASTSIIKVSLDNKVPYYAFVSSQIKKGALAACARDYTEAGYEAGEMAVKVLNGADPEQIPFQVVAKTLYFVNMESANFLNIPIPANLKLKFPEVEILEKIN
jgi:ABC-type uncharacterized transport system substrate-binding protein